MTGRGTCSNGDLGIRMGSLLVHDAAKPWDRRSPERLGINAQVDDLFHGRLDTGGPRGSRLTQHYNDARAGLRLTQHESDAPPQLNLLP